MLSKDPSPTPDTVNARLIQTAVKRFPPSSTIGLWATAVWGTKPALDRNTPLEFPSLWDSSAAGALRMRGCSAPSLNAAAATFLPEAIKNSLYGDN